MSPSIMGDVNFNRVNPMHKVPPHREEDDAEKRKKKDEKQEQKQQNQDQKNDSESEKDKFEAKKEEVKDASNPGFTMDWVHLHKIKKATESDQPSSTQNKATDKKSDKLKDKFFKTKNQILEDEAE